MVFNLKTEKIYKYKRGVPMEKRYIIGVDGGNTKTDYFLFDTEGNYVSSLRAGTCSHERMPDGYEGSYREMQTCIAKLLGEQGLAMNVVEAGVFGLAGLDVPIQKENLEKVIARIGFEKYVAENDGYLGLKAGSVSGAGICSINGTGTVTTGIDYKGNRLQVGGVGYISGDDAGGAFIARELFREIHDTLYRCGVETTLLQPVCDLLGVEDKAYYIQVISALYSSGFSHTPYIQLVFEHAGQGDRVALKIIHKVAREIAKSTAGCINNLSFEENEVVEIILAGSVWVKPKTPVLIEAYKMYVESLTDAKCTYTILQVPPGIGAVLWALEVAKGHPVDEVLKERIIEEMEELYKD